MRSSSWSVWTRCPPMTVRRWKPRAPSGRISCSRMPLRGEDSYTSLEKQHTLMKLIFAFEDKARRAVADGADVEDVSNLPVRERIGRFKAVPSASCRAEADAVTAAMTAELDGLVARARHA